MAKKYDLTTAFAAITETSGTIQNVGKEAVELASSTNAVEGEGIVLNPSEKRSFKGALSARSMGDAGAVVNVVDFTEAGEGGEEYDLPIASATTLGGVKIGNSFTVTDDGTLSIKKSGKTILGGVKSSDDEGKVTVNNDGTMTYNPSGYRQPSTTYAIGNIKYHASLPTGWYLECTTAGISGSGDLMISNPSVNQTITDGTVTWTVHNKSQIQLNNLPKVVGDYNNYTSPGVYNIYNDVPAGDVTPANASPVNFGILIVDNSSFLSQTVADVINNHFYTRTFNGTVWTSWIQQEAIVAKSLGTNGYIKYASGLIVQWGRVMVNANTTTTSIPFPISFTSWGSYSLCVNLENPLSYTGFTGNTYIANSIELNHSSYSTDRTCVWFAIGY